MSAQLLDGRELAEEIRDQLKAQAERLFQEYRQRPRVVNIKTGEDLGATAYANSQRRAAESIGIDYCLETQPEGIRQEDLIARIHELNRDKDIHGIMLHKPLPPHLDYSRIANHVHTAKDLEGINVSNIGRMILGKSNLIPCTPAAVMAHIHSTGEKIYGKETVIVGHSEIVGKPLSMLLLRELATVTVCHVATYEAGYLIDHIRRADILVVAVGKAGLVKGEWIKSGSTVIDVGINQIGGKFLGDVEFHEARDRASYITPVPGGVGPVTVVMLMKNALEAFKLQMGQAGEE